MKRLVKYTGIVLLLSMSLGAAGLQAQQPVAAEPQVPSSGVQAPREVVPALPVPRLVKFSGVVKDELGGPHSGTVGITFAIYKDQEGGAAQWLETQNVQLDEQGHYTVLLGASKSEGLPLELFSAGEPRWLGVLVNLPHEVEQPRVLLVSVPYALKAADADTLGGRPLSSFVLNDVATPGAQKEPTSNKGQRALQTGVGCSGITSDGTATTNSIALFSSTCNIESSLMTQTLVNGFPGVNLVGDNTGLLLSGTGSHEVGVTSTTTGVSGRLGQDSDGFFFASDTNGKAVRFYTNNGTLNEGMRITSAGGVGIGTLTPSQRLEVAGNVKISGGGSALVFPDGTVMSTATAGVGGGTITGVTAGTGMSGGGTTGGVTLNNAGVLSFNGRPGIVAPTAGDYSFPEISGAATTAQLPAASLVRAITYLAGCDNCSLLTTMDSQSTIFQNLIGAMTINSVTCFSDAGAPIINAQVNHGGTLTKVLSSDLTCSNSGATSTSFTTSALSVNDILNFTLVTADGVAKRVTMVIKATVN